MNERICIYRICGRGDGEKLKSAYNEPVQKPANSILERKVVKKRSALLSSEIIDIDSEPCILLVLTYITEKVLLRKRNLSARSIKFDW